MLIIALALAAADFEDLDALDAQLAAAGAGAVAPVDRRLHLRRCPEGVLVEAAGAGALAVRCSALGWRLRVPLVKPLTETTAAPAVRRGDPLVVRVAGAGFTVEANGVAGEDGARGARVRAKLDGGALVAGQVTAAGEITLAGLKPADAGPLPGAEEPR